MSPLRRSAHLPTAVAARTLAAALLLGTLVAAPGSSAPPPVEAAAATEVRAQRDRPNIVLITSDDQTDDELAWMPRTKRLLARAGISFTDALSPHPLCCPARAAILTGEYAQNNGVRHNDGPKGGYSSFMRGNGTEHVATWLRRAGYRTGFVGKTLNGYTFESERQAGWDFFSPTGAGAYGYYGTSFYNNGRPRTFGDEYVADVVRDESVRLVEKWSRGSEPFFLWASHVGPHAAVVDGRWRSPVPAKRHAHLFKQLELPSQRKPSFLEPDRSDKPRAVRTAKARTRAELTAQFRDRVRSLQAIDEANAATIRALERTGELSSTVVVYVSDNGFAIGEHGLFTKDLPYDEVLQVPLLVRGPGIEAGTRSGETASLVDLAPTFLDYAGVLQAVRRRGHTDGASLRGVLEQGRSLNDTSLIQAGTSDPKQLRAFGWAWRGVRTARYTYALWWDGFVELYDRQEDPYEVSNLAGRNGRLTDASYAGVLDELQRRYRALRECRGVAQCEQQDLGSEPRPGPQPRS